MNWEITTNRTRLTWLLIINSGTHSLTAISFKINIRWTFLIFFRFNYSVIYLWTLCTLFMLIHFMCLVVLLCVSHGENKGHFTLLYISKFYFSSWRVANWVLLDGVCMLRGYLIITAVVYFRWVRDFLSEQYNGLDILVGYLSFAQSIMR